MLSLAEFAEETFIFTQYYMILQFNIVQENGLLFFFV